MQLTGGSIEKLMAGGTVENPILQVLAIKKISGSGGNSSDRYRILLSDGKHSHSSAMLATQLNNLVSDNLLDSNSVIKVNKYMCNCIQDRRVVILLDLSVVATGSEVGEKLGNPEPYKPGSGGSGSVSAPPSNPPSNQSSNGPVSKPAPATPKQNGHSTPGQSGPSRSFYGNNSTSAAARNIPNTPGGTPAKVHPISSLTPYQNRWTVRARVTQKSNVRTWSNSRGEGKLFNMNLLDESGEIRATAFKEQVDKFYEMIDVNKVYFVSKATLKTADKRYSSLDNDYEMTFNSETQMWACEEEVDLPSVNFNFIPINQLEGHQPQSTVDVIGVVKQCDDLNTVTGRQSNREIKKRDLHVVDQGQVVIRLTLWGNDAENFDGSNQPVVAVKGCRLSDWGGRSLSALASSQIILNPDIPESHCLRGWYDSDGQHATYSEYKSDTTTSGGHTTNWKTFGEVKGEPPQGDQAVYYTAKATIVFLKKDNCMYQACPSSDCNKKVVDQANGYFRCEKCQKEYPNYKWRMILSCNLSDFTDNQWATCFQETAELILGKEADEIGQLKQNNESEFDQIFQEANFKTYIFKLRAKLETYNDESRLKTVCVQATAVNYKEYNKKLMTDIENLLKG